MQLLSLYFYYNIVSVEENKLREQRLGRVLQSSDINNYKGGTNFEISENDKYSTSLGTKDINLVKDYKDSESVVHKDDITSACSDGPLKVDDVSIQFQKKIDVEEVNSSCQNVNDVIVQPEHNDVIANLTNSEKGIDLKHKATSFQALDLNKDVDDKHIEIPAGADISMEGETDDVLRDLEKGLFTKISDDEYADCIFLDFAGHKEYYTTHQTFLTKKAVYLITTSLHDNDVFSNEDSESKSVFRLRYT